MRVGYHISPEYTIGTDLARAIRDQQRIVAAAKDLGMDTVTCAEHFSRGDSVWLPPLMTLARVSEVAEGMTLGTAVLAAALHHPLALAEEVAYLDAATEGRFVLGLASGWNRREFDAMGVPMERRGQAVDELIEFLRLLWGSEGPVSYHGSVYRFDNITMSFRPQHGAEQPIWLGASTDVALRRTVKLADTWLVSSHMSTAEAGRQASEFERLLAESGRPVPAIRPGLKSIYVSRTVEEAKAEGGAALMGSYQMFQEWGLFQDIFNSNIDQVSYTDVTERAVIGSPETTAEALVNYLRATRVNMLLVRGQWIGMDAANIIDSLELLMTEVIPLVDRELSNGPSAGS